MVGLTTLKLFVTAISLFALLNARELIYRGDSFSLAFAMSSFIIGLYGIFALYRTRNVID